MKKLIRSILDRLSDHSLSDEFPSSPESSQPNWQDVARERAENYTTVMLDRIARLSAKQQDSINLPNTLYHASLHSGLETLDPKKGQGLGVWFQDDLAEASHFCVSRSRDPYSGEQYTDTDPSIYEAKLNVQKFAIFPDEISLYHMKIFENGDGDELMFPPSSVNNMDNVREKLREAGYDGIYLIREGTFSVINSAAIEIVKEHDPYPIYDEHIKPNLAKRVDDDAIFPWALE